MIRLYSELCQLATFEERFRYLSLRGTVGEATFGFDRYLNQRFYRSKEWRDLRHHIIVRDNGCDLGVPGYDIHSNLYVHHINPIVRADIENADPSVFDPEYLITTTHRTHNAIHYGDETLLAKKHVDRHPGDTKLWGSTKELR